MFAGQRYNAGINEYKPGQVDAPRVEEWLLGIGQVKSTVTGKGRIYFDIQSPTFVLTVDIRRCEQQAGGTPATNQETVSL